MPKFLNLSVPTARSFTRQLIASIVAVVAVAVLLMFAFAAWSMQRVDEAALDRQIRFVVSGLNQEMRNLPVEQSSVTTWDEAVQRVKGGDTIWTELNLTLGMATHFGLDRAYVLDEHDLPVASMSDGKVVDNTVFDQDSFAVQPLISHLRAQMRLASGPTLDAAAIGGFGAEDIAVLSGKPAIISVKPIVPNSALPTRVTGTEYLHVAVRFIGQALVDKIARRFALAGPHLTSRPAEGFWTASVPVANAAGHVFSFIEWTRDRPGVTLVEEAAPGLIGGTLAGLTVVWLLLGRLRRSSVELQASEAQAQYLAFHDTLTGLPNRALFEQRLDEALQQASSSVIKLALLCIDLDRFKNVNDTLGHPAGDELVRLVGKRLSTAIGAADTVARLGGDEFAIVQVDIAGDRDPELLAQRIARELEKPFEITGTSVFISASVGIALSEAELTGRDDMLRKADIALYEAKSHGRSRYQVFAGTMDDIVRQRRVIESELRAALNSGTQIGVVYQPIFSASGKIVGAEALVRWNHPVHGLLSPELFIGIAEERGLIEHLGETVLRQACTFIRDTDLPWIAVNVSPVQFRNERLVERLLAVVRDSGLPPNRLQLEITEGVLLENPAMTDAILKTLRETGIRIALDDFGTGYSSMNYLRSYSVDKLKIDRSFIQELGTSPGSDAIVRAMVTLGRALQMRVTAEGVETIEQRDQLASIGCHELQGFLLSRPLTPDQLKALLAGKESKRHRPITRSAIVS